MFKASTNNNKGFFECPVCGDYDTIDNAVNCDICETPHHRDCYEYNRGCATYGCKETALIKQTQPSFLRRMKNNLVNSSTIREGIEEFSKFAFAGAFSILTTPTISIFRSESYLEILQGCLYFATIPAALILLSSGLYFGIHSFDAIYDAYQGHIYENPQPRLKEKSKPT